MGSRRATGTGSSDGFALIAVLWFLVLLSAVGAYMVVNARSQTALAHNVLAEVRAEAVADAAVARAVINLTEPDQDKRWKLNGTQYQVNLSGGAAVVQLYDERAKINPNLASDILLTHFFESIGLDNAQAGHLGAAIADWVSKGDQARPLGAKLPQYQDAGRKYGPPGAPVESIDELELVLGMTPQLLNAAKPYFTIFTQDAIPPHLALAAKPVVQAVQAASHDPASNSPGVTQGDLANAPAAGAGGQPNLEAPAGGPGVPGLPGAPGVPGVPGTGQPAADAVIVTVDATGRSFDGGTFARRAVIKLDFDNPKGYTVLDWRRIALAN